MSGPREQTFTQEPILVIRFVLRLPLRLAVFGLLKPPLLIICDAFQVEEE